MRRCLEKRLLVPIDMYKRCLSETAAHSQLDQLAAIVPDPPRWLNDFYAANALETLVKKRRAAIANLHQHNVWPASPTLYLFVSNEAGRAAEDVAYEIETNDLCHKFQTFDLCPQDRRFDEEPFARTVAYNEVQRGESPKLRESASPCPRCWDRAADRQHMAMLVGNLLENDLRPTLIAQSVAHIMDEPAQYWKDNTLGPFMEQAVTSCIAGGLTADKRNIEAVRQRVQEALEHYPKQGAPP